MDWNKLKQAGAKAADSAVRTAGSLYEKGKKEAKLMALESKLSRAQRELGALVYSLRRTGQANEALIESLCDDIAAIEARIASLHAPVSQPQAMPEPDARVKCCSQCGAEVDKEAMFCHGCGGQMG